MILLRFPPAIYERFANPSERPMTAFSFECGGGSEKPSKHCSDSMLEDYTRACRAILLHPRSMREAFACRYLKAA